MVTEYTFSDGSMLRETSGKGERGKYKREVFSGQFMAAKAAKEAALEAKKAQEDAEWKAESSARAAENDRKINELLDTITVDPCVAGKVARSGSRHGGETCERTQRQGFNDGTAVHRAQVPRRGGT
jgi:hypothetical protein